ncbi:hypothetical protein [Haliangium ochraceum]|nr:hypothetical protein [Haliangium ochraceum]
MLRHSYWLLAALLAAGCGADDSSAPDAAPAAPDASVDSGVLRPEGPGVSGVLRDDSGQPLGGAQILGCMATVCLFGQTEADGRFLFEVDPPAEIAIKTPEVLNRSPRRGATLCPVRLDDTALVDVGSVFVPTLPEGVPFGPASGDPQTLDAGDELTLTLRRGDLSPRIGDVLVDLAARRIPAAHIPALPELGGEEVLAVYAMHPFGAHSSSPIAVSVASSLPAGTPVKFRSISEIDGRLSEVALGQATGTALETDPDAGIHELSWLVVSR